MVSLRHSIPVLLALMMLLLTGCDDMEPSERLIYEKPAAARRVVLLEDFTGQRCTNCPRGTDIIEQLEHAYGDTAFVAVGIHGGPLGFAGNATTLGLATAVGDEYYNHWHLEYQPVGLVNRHTPINYPEWIAAVREELAKPAPLSLEAVAELAGGAINISVKAMGTDGSTVGKLQVWLVEDGITALQLMPDGTANAGYVHNHVLRTPVNGTWGDDFAIQEGETLQKTYSQSLQDAWNAERLSIVAFVYNDSGVQQTVKTRVSDK